MFRPALLISAVALLLLAGAAPQAEQPDARYKLTPTDGGAFLRLDTQTGATSVCRRKPGGWACEAAADDRRALETEIDRLAKENTDLKSAVRRLEELLKLPDPDAKSTKPGGLKLRLPTEQQVDRAVGYVAGIVHKFKEKMRRLRDRDRWDYSDRGDDGDYDDRRYYGDRPRAYQDRRDN
jgi:hypothetical protein